MAGESQLLRFYRRNGVDAEGRTLAEILVWDDESLESVHDYIQWLFPNRQPSAFNRNAPPLTDADIAAFLTDPVLRAALLRSWERMVAFYGFERAGAEIRPSARFKTASRSWLRPGSHNLLRITRILTALNDLGCPREAQAFLNALRAAVAGRPEFATSLRYWEDAVE